MIETLSTIINVHVQANLLLLTYALTKAGNVRRHNQCTGGWQPLLPPALYNTIHVGLFSISRYLYTLYVHVCMYIQVCCYRASHTNSFPNRENSDTCSTLHPCALIYMYMYTYHYNGLCIYMYVLTGITECSSVLSVKRPWILANLNR